MELEVLDVDHGFCAIGTLPNGHTFLVDAGHSSARLRPSALLRSRGLARVDSLYVTNYDEDHLSDLPQVRAVADIRLLYRNTSISPAVLRQLKLQTCPFLGPGITSLIGMMTTFTLPIHETPGVVPADGLETAVFFNPYPEFVDTNNLSIALFMRWGTTCLLFPGDLERAGWLVLLRQPAFRLWLGHVNIFVASHHGRESGYCAEVFDFATPDVILASDCSVRFGTQIVNYSCHARGITWNGGPELRRYLTTRCDGSMHISFAPTNYHITVSH